MRKLNKPKTNREVYDRSVAIDVWVKWAQNHPDRFESYSEWMDLPYEETKEESKNVAG